MAVALTHTINTVFASQVLDTETGIILNNEVSNAPLFIGYVLTVRVDG